jgi:hypothetical protein
MDQEQKGVDKRREEKCGMPEISGLARQAGVNLSTFRRSAPPSVIPDLVSD